MSKIFPGGGEEGGAAAENEESIVKEKQAKKYLEETQEDDEGKTDGRKPAWESPRSKQHRNDGEEHGSGEERKHRHHHHHKSKDSHSSSHHKHKDHKHREPHSNAKSDSGSDDSAEATDPTKVKDLELGAEQPDNESGPPPPLEKTASYVEAVDLLFRRVKNNVDALSQYMPAHEEDQVLTTITEVLWKPYSRTLKAFAYTLWLSQVVTLIALFWSMLPCPDQKIDWSVVIGLPLCCGYGSLLLPLPLLLALSPE
jgi:hypothetical protein